MPRRAAGLAWEDADGEHTVQLQYQLLELRPSIRRPTWQQDSISGAVHAAHAGDEDAVCDVEGVIRFVSRPTELINALSDRIGDEIIYYEERGGQIEEFPAVLLSVSPGGVDRVGLNPDPARYGFGEFAVTVVLRFADLDVAEDLYAFTGE